jgi:F-type H+-transporting ATPase subunit epsilon
VTEPFRLVVLTPVQTLLTATDVAWAQIQLADGGPIGIYPGHAPLLAETVDGPLRYADESGEHSLHLRAGILSISQDGVTVLTAGQAQDGSEADREAEVSPEETGVREEAEKLRFERLVQASLDDENGIAKNVASWLTRRQTPGL